MIRPQSIWNFLYHYKYHTVIIVGVAVVGFIDENSFLNRFKHQQEISELKHEIAKYNDMYRNDKTMLYQLEHNTKAIEKIARERYFMKATDEDIFILSDDEQKINEKNEKAE
jgi:cell division protein FtsB